MVKKNGKITLSLIFLNYNSQFWIKKALESLNAFYLKKTKYKIEILVVDNNSTDHSISMIKNDYKFARIIQTGHNLGFAGGNNVGLKTAKGKYIMLLNSDVEFTEKTNLDELINYMDNNQKVGAVSPKVELTNGDLDKACHRGEPTPWAAFTHYSKLAKLFPKRKLFGQYHLSYKDLNIAHSIDACTGAAMMVRKSVIDKIGGLDETFFMYGEDLDWCKRIRESGNKIIYYPNVVIKHHKYKSGIKSHSNGISKKIRAQFYESMLKYYDKHYKKQYPQIVRFFVKLFVFIKKGGL